MTTSEIAAEHGVSRQTVHAHRKRGAFPAPVEGEGSTRPRFRADEVATFFAANPPTPGKRTDLPAKQQGEPTLGGRQRGGLSREDAETCEQLHATADLIEARWPDVHPTLVRDLRDLVDNVIEESGASDG
ncbi:helix-turn-helix transcriptional regulator [Streptomyces sp. NPDC091292]|uniref:helix-turn-helix transcriptional regulator n=1 Tax=Streptomyces sp. NPDC091292 TaxID=3365991 RepID=UPI003809E35B